MTRVVFYGKFFLGNNLIVMKMHKNILKLLGLLVVSSFETSHIYAADIAEYDDSSFYADNFYVGLSVGYAHSELGYLTKGTPVVANPAILNELVPTVAMRGQQYTVGVNAGYKFDALRAEVSGEYRLHAGDSIAGGAETGDFTMSSKTEQYAGLVSLYYDLEIPDTSITPYIGFGAGLAHTKTNFAVVHTNGPTITNGNLRYSLGASFANAAMAGISMQLADSFTLDFGYKFMAIGGGNASFAGADNAAGINAAAGMALVNAAGFAPGESLIFPDFASHEVKLGVRYSF